MKKLIKSLSFSYPNKGVVLRSISSEDQIIKFSKVSKVLRNDFNSGYFIYSVVLRPHYYQDHSVIDLERFIPGKLIPRKYNVNPELSDVLLSELILKHNPGLDFKLRIVSNEISLRGNIHSHGIFISKEFIPCVENS